MREYENLENEEICFKLRVSFFKKDNQIIKIKNRTLLICNWRGLLG